MDDVENVRLDWRVCGLAIPVGIRTLGLACVRGYERCINQENPHPSFLSLAAYRFFRRHIIRAHTDHCTTLGENIMEMWGICQVIPLLDGIE